MLDIAPEQILLSLVKKLTTTEMTPKALVEFYKKYDIPQEMPFNISLITTRNDMENIPKKVVKGIVRGKARQFFIDSLSRLNKQFHSRELLAIAEKEGYSMSHTGNMLTYFKKMGYVQRDTRKGYWIKNA